MDTTDFLVCTTSLADANGDPLKDSFSDGMLISTIDVIQDNNSLFCNQN
jgi:hypothetical protein